MKAAFQSGTAVRFSSPDGARANIIRYLEEGFYLVRTVPDGRELVVQEDDLILDGAQDARSHGVRSTYHC